MFRVSCIQLCSSDCIKSNLERSERLIKKDEELTQISGELRNKEKELKSLKYQ